MWVRPTRPTHLIRYRKEVVVFVGEAPPTAKCRVPQPGLPLPPKDARRRVNPR